MNKVGDEVVLMSVYTSGPLAPTNIAFGYPCQHNSKHSPKHPCRGKITKIGRKYIHVQSCYTTGMRARPYVENTEGVFAVPVEEAKKLYRRNMEAMRGGVRTQKFINQCVENL